MSQETLWQNRTQHKQEHRSLTGGTFDLNEFAQKILDDALNLAFEVNQKLPLNHPGLVLASQHGAQCPFTQPNEPLVGKPPVDKPLVKRGSKGSEEPETARDHAKQMEAVRKEKRMASLRQRRSDSARLRQQDPSYDLFSSAVDPLVGGPLVNRLGNESKSEVNRLGNESKSEVNWLGNESKSDKHPTDRGSKGSEEVETTRDRAKQIEAERKEKRMAGLRQRRSDFRQQHSSDEHPTDLFSSAASAVDPLVGGNRLMNFLSGAWKIVKYSFWCLIPMFHGKNWCDTIAGFFLWIMLFVAAYCAWFPAAGVTAAVAFMQCVELLFGSAFLGWFATPQAAIVFEHLGIQLAGREITRAGLTYLWHILATGSTMFFVKKLLQTFTCFCADEVLQPTTYGLTLTQPDQFPEVLKDETFSKEDATRIAQKYHQMDYDPEQKGSGLNKDKKDEEKIATFLKLLDTLSDPKGMQSVKILTKEENEKLIFIMGALREDRKKRLEDTKRRIEALNKEQKVAASNETTQRLTHLEKQVKLFEQQGTILVTRKLELDRWMRCHPQREATTPWYKSLFGVASTTDAAAKKKPDADKADAAQNNV